MEKLFTSILVVLLLKLPLILCKSSENRCFGRVIINESSDGDLPQDCAFSLYAAKKHAPRGFFKYLFQIRLPSKIYQNVLSLYFAIEEINSNPYLLPNVSLEISYLGRNCNDYLSILPNLPWMTRHLYPVPNYQCYQRECLLVLTGPLWRTSAQVAQFLQLDMTPQITYGPFHPPLSDQDKFPNLHQIAPQDKYLSGAMVSLLLYFNWTWVGLVIHDDDQGNQFLLDIRGEMQRNGVCLAFVNVIPEDMQLFMTKAELYYHQITTSSANIVIIYGEMNSTLEVSFNQWKYLGTQKIWVTTSQWDAIIRESDPSLPSFQGTFTFSHYHGRISTFNNFVHRVNFSKDTEYFSLQKLGWMHSNCSLLKYDCKTPNNCTSNISWDLLSWHRYDMAMNDECYNIYNAVYAVAHALHEILLQQIDFQQLQNSTTSVSVCLEIHRFLKNMQFSNPLGDTVNMNQQTKPGAEYDIHIISNFPQGLGMKVNIGWFSSHFPYGQQLYLSDDMMQWATVYKQIPASVCSVSCTPGFKKSHIEGKASCCFDCSRCPENEISNATDLAQCVKCPDDQYANPERNHCFPKAVSFLAYEDHLGMALAYMASCFYVLTVLILVTFVKYQHTPIVKANNYTLSYILLISLKFCFLCSLLFIGYPSTARCLLQQISFGVLFTLAMSTVLAKTITVLLAFRITAPGRRVKGMLLSGTHKVIIPICTLFQLVLCGFWLGTYPPFVEKDAHSEHGRIIIVCNKGSLIAFYCMLGYLGSLALASFTVAFLARNLPDTFNEAKFLTFSMLVFCSVWVTFLPVYHSTKGKIMVAVEVFSILTSSAGLLGCIFLPKCYIILIRPDRNFVQKSKGQNHS